MKELDEMLAEYEARAKEDAIRFRSDDIAAHAEVDVPRLVAALRHALDFAGDDAIGKTLAAEVATILRGDQ